MKRTRYNFFNLPIVFLLIQLFLSCSEDIDLRNGIYNYESDLKINVFIPENTILKTRDDSQFNDEIEVESAVLLIFDSEGNLKGKREYTSSEFTSGSNTHTIQLSLSGEEKLDNSTIYLVANPGTILDSFNGNINDLESKTINLAESTTLTSPFIMSGKVVVKAGVTNVSLSLYRLSAKLTLLGKEDMGNYTIEEYSLYNISNGAKLKSPDSGEVFSDFVEGHLSDPILLTSFGEQNPVYFYPSSGARNEGQLEDGAYILLKVKNSKNEESYFCLYPRLKNNSSVEYLDFLPNHWYQVLIDKIYTDGHPTAEDAKAHPEIDDTHIEWNIYDHAAKVMSIASDGIRELATDREIKITSSMDNEQNGYVLSLRCYSVHENEIPENMKAPEAIINQDEKWLSISNGTSVTLELSAQYEKNQSGREFTYKVWIEDITKVYNDKSAVISFEWMGLKREIPVFYNSNFEPENYTSVSLKYVKNDEGTNEIIDDYWNFLSKKLKGAEKDNLSDNRIRNEGFHFPMPYGKNKQYWEYEYEIDFTEIAKKDWAYITCSFSGDEFFTKEGNVIWSIDPLNNQAIIAKGILKLNPELKGDFTYATGSVTFTIIYDEIYKRNPDVLTFDLYHTGFFHEPKGLEFPCYYEVISLGDDHWLDRNLGAVSNKMYVEYENSSYGESGAAGLFYKVANEGLEFNSPVILNEICPPGYHIPNTTEWDKVRNSQFLISERISENNENYYTTYFRTTERKAPKVYFPKSRFHNSSSVMESGWQLEESANNGFDATGYYWTSTESIGQEKIQIGKWLKSLTMSGNSNTYINGSIQNHLMNVRCVAGDKAPEEVKYSIDFNVKGATHVYLYTLDGNGNKSGVFSFPGKSIGSATNMKEINSKDDTYSFHFSYRSNDPSSSLYVFFAYKDDNGKIMVISNDNPSYTHERNLSVNDITDSAKLYDSSGFNFDEIQGWPVWIGANYFFKWNESQSNLEDTHIFMGESNDSDVPKIITYKLYYQSEEELPLYLKVEEGGFYDWGNHSELFGKGWYVITFTSLSSNGDLTYKIGSEGPYIDNKDKDKNITVKNGLSKFSEPDSEGIRHGWIQKSEVNVIHPGIPEIAEKTYRIYWPVYCGPGLHILGIDGVSENIEDSRFRGKQEGQYYYFDFSTEDQISTIDLQYSNFNGTGDERDNNKGILSENLNFNNCFREDIQNGKRIYIGYLYGQSRYIDEIKSGSPYNFQKGDNIHFYWSKNLRNNGTLLRLATLFTDSWNEDDGNISEETNYYTLTKTYYGSESSVMYYELAADTNGQDKTDGLYFTSSEATFSINTGGTRNWTIYIEEL